MYALFRHEVVVIPFSYPGIGFRPNANVNLSMPAGQMPGKQRRCMFESIPQLFCFSAHKFRISANVSTTGKHYAKKPVHPTYLPTWSVPTLLSISALTFSQPCPVNPPTPSSAPCTCEMTFCIQSWPQSCYCGNAQKQRCFQKCGGVQPEMQVPPPTTPIP